MPTLFDKLRSSVAVRVGASAVAVTVGLAGCAALPSTHQIVEDVRRERTAAYAQWEATRDNDRADGGQVRVGGPLSLDDAIKVALQYNKSLQTFVEQKDVVRGQSIAAWQIALPNATVYGNYDRWTQTGNYPGGTTLNRYGAGFTVTQPLGQGAKIPATLRQARLFQALADEDVRQVVEDVILQTATAYYDVVLAQELIKVHEAALDSAEAQLQVVKTRREAGTALEYEVLRAQVERSNTDVDRITQKNNAAVAMTSLLRIMGVSQDSVVELVDPLEFFPMTPVFERAVELAFTNRPDIASAQMNVRVREEAVKIAQSAWWPSFTATISQNYGKPVPTNAGGNHWNHDALAFGLNMSYVIQAADTLGQQRAEAAKLRQQRIALLDKQDQALQEIRSTMSDIENSEELVHAQEVSQVAATESLRLADVGYRSGVTPSHEVVNARAGQTTAQGNYYQALYRHTIARLSLKRAMGVLGIKPGQSTVPTSIPTRPATIEEFMGATPPALTGTTAALEQLAEQRQAVVMTPAAPAAEPVATSPAASPATLPFEGLGVSGASATAPTAAPVPPAASPLPSSASAPALLMDEPEALAYADADRQSIPMEARPMVAAHAPAARYAH